MKQMKLLMALIFTLGLSQSLDAQEYYQSAIGLRLGIPTSISYKTFLDDKAAIEAYAGWRSYGFGSWINVSGAYQVHNTIDDVDGLQWYFGGGASLFFWNYDDIFFDDSFSSTSFGIQGYLGLDYTFDSAPINLSVDWVPTFFLGGSLNVNSFGAGYGSLAVRYIFNQ